MPDVRCACAAQSSARAARRLHHTSARPGHPFRRLSASRRAASRDARSHPAPVQSQPFAVSSTSPSGTVALLAREAAPLSRITVHPALSPFGSFVPVAFTDPSDPCSPSTFGTQPKNTEGLAMPSFKAPTASGSVPPHGRRCEAALGLSRVHRRLRSSSTRPESKRSHLTPGCSGLAALAAEP